MFDAPFHPKLVHLPLGLATVLPVVFVILLVSIRRAWLPVRTWWFAVLGAAVVAAGAFAAAQSGESDEQWVEPVVAEALIEAHEEAGQRVVITAVVTTLLAAAGVFLRHRDTRALAHAIATVGAIVTLAMAIRAGQLGGELVYKHGAASAFTTTPATEPSAKPQAGIEAGRAEADD